MHSMGLLIIYSHVPCEQPSTPRGTYQGFYFHAFVTYDIISPHCMWIDVHV